MNDEDIMSEEEANELMEQAVEDMADPEEYDAEQEIDPELIGNARLRLAQGSLYEMLLKHDFFEGMEADPKAVANVQKEVRAFVKERLEVLVGLRTDPRVLKETLKIELPFNDLEIELLKKLCAKASNGATINVPSEPAKVQAKRVENRISPVRVTSTQKPNRLNRQDERPKSTLQKPVDKLKEKPLDKSPYEMTPKELIAQSKERSLNQKYRSAKNPNKLPAPDAEQMTMQYSQSQASYNANPMFNTILNKVGRSQMIETVSDTFESTGDDRI